VRVFEQELEHESGLGPEHGFERKAERVFEREQRESEPELHGFELALVRVSELEPGVSQLLNESRLAERVFEQAGHASLELLPSEELVQWGVEPPRHESHRRYQCGNPYGHRYDRLVWCR